MQIEQSHWINPVYKKKFLKFSYVIAEKDAPMVEEYNVFVNLGVGLLGLQTDK